MFSYLQCMFGVAIYGICFFTFLRTSVFEVSTLLTIQLYISTLCKKSYCQKE